MTNVFLGFIVVLLIYLAFVGAVIVGQLQGLRTTMSIRRSPRDGEVLRELQRIRASLPGEW